MYFKTSWNLGVIKTLKFLPLPVIFISQLNATPAIRVNQVGYERIGTKTALIENNSTFTPAKSFTLKNDSGSIVFTGTPSPVSTVDGWNDRYFSRLDFTACTTSGTFTIGCDNNVSDPFAIENNCAYTKTVSSVIAFFNSMRNTDAGDHELGVFNATGKKVDVYGGWNDATGDRGKYLSHLSFANYFNPQQIPLVVWSLCKTIELGSSNASSEISAATSEAGWGADYLVRALDSAGYFYITVFDGWGWQTPREVCAWRDTNGVKTADYQAGYREGGGMGIAALAYASRMKIPGELSSKYSSSAVKAYSHLKINSVNYLDDKKENIIDDYCALIAAVELFKTTTDQSYLTDARVRATSIMDKQHNDGWFYSDNEKTRPFYHAADEGLPMIALMELASIDENLREDIYTTIRKASLWYQSVTNSVTNPFSYIRQISAVSGSNGVSIISTGKQVAASSAETSPQVHPAVHAFDNDLNTRWASDTGSNNEWIQVDLGNTYNIESVAITWEAAYGKQYKINVSLDNSTWTTAAAVTNTEGAVRKVTTLGNIPARYVRMQGVERGSRYGYSIFEFAVYGKMEVTVNKFTNTFFIPHTNETGYWWQGENARIASLASALYMAERLPVFSYDESLQLSNLAQQQIDWILGKNPFGICMMFGFGKTNYPSYEGKAGYTLSNVKGGICNGITSSATNESDIVYMPYAGPDAWKNWRWVEQWLPHNAWFLTATAQQSFNFYNPRSPVLHNVTPRLVVHARFTLTKTTLRIQLPQSKQMFKPDDICIQNLQGRTLRTTPQINGKTATISIDNLVAGAYIARIRSSGEAFCFTITSR